MLLYYNMSDFTDKADDLDAALACIMMISATTLLNLYDELSECCTKKTECG